MDCVILAGGAVAPDDPLYTYSNDRNKALIDVNGRPMLAHVVSALQGSKHVDNVIIVGLGESLPGDYHRPVHHLPDAGSIVGNVLAGIAWVQRNNPSARTVLLSSADIPTITADIVDQFVESCRPFDKALYYTLVTQEVMEARFPSSNRTFVKLKGLRVAGGDLFLADPALAESNQELWETLTNARKHAWKLARVVGLPFLLKFLLRRLSVAEIEALGPRLLGRPIKVILSPHAELAMDADKPEQVDLVRRDLRDKEK